MRRRVAVLVPIGALLLVLLGYVSSRSASGRQPRTGEKASPATRPFSEQQAKAVADGYAPSAKINAWAILLQVMQRLDDSVTGGSLSMTRSDLALADSALSTLATENKKESSPGTDRIDNGLRVLMRQIAALRPAGDVSGRAPSGATSREIKSTCEDLQRLYEPAVLDQARALAERYRCPMHPDVIGMKGAICPKCGMPLSTQVQLSTGVLPPAAELASMIRAQVDTDAPLQVGVKTSAHLILYRPQGEPVTPDQLAEVHLQRIHLLIIDGSFTDYHHEHPQPTNVAGRYDFTFTPQKSGTYRIWADVQPYLTGIQEYVMTVIPAATSEEPLRDTADKLEATVNGLHYAIQFQQPVKAGETAMGTLHITQADGSGFTRLEPVMDAFAHLVGFHENHTTVLHIHPEMSQPPAPNDRGGPDLHFRLFAPIPGFFRLFVQVQRDGVQQFASFALNVAPGTTPWIDQEPAHFH
jgi:Heavy metal binding domain